MKWPISTSGAGRCSKRISDPFISVSCISYHILAIRALIEKANEYQRKTTENVNGRNRMAIEKATNNCRIHIEGTEQ